MSITNFFRDTLRSCVPSSVLDAIIVSLMITGPAGFILGRALIVERDWPMPGTYHCSSTRSDLPYMTMCSNEKDQAAYNAAVDAYYAAFKPLWVSILIGAGIPFGLMLIDEICQRLARIYTRIYNSFYLERRVQSLFFNTSSTPIPENIPFTIQITTQNIPGVEVKTNEFTERDEETTPILRSS